MSKNMSHFEMLKGKSQSDKFKYLAREVEADEDEAAFDAKLKKMRDRRDALNEKDLE